MRRTRIPQRTGRRRPAREHRGAAGARGRRSPRSQAGRPPSHGTEASEFCTDRAGPEDGKAGGGLGLVPPSADGGPRIRRTSLVATPEGAHPLPLLTAGAAEAAHLGPADSQQTWRNRVSLGPTPRSVGTACAHPPVMAPARESPPGRERGQRKGGTGNPGSTPSPDPPRSGSRADFPPSSFLVLHVCFPRSCRAARAFAPFAQTWVQAARLAPGRGGAGPSLQARGPRSRKPSAWGGLRLPTRGGDRHAPTDEERGNELSQSPLASRRGQR